MKFIKLEAITAKAAQALRDYGNVWEIQGKVENPDTYFFQSRKTFLYITPIAKSTKNPREDIGDNYKEPSQIINAGARWILESNDPDFEYTENKFGRA